ncbi:MAG: hypothetical protein K5829_07540 [Treponema sp.]|nr:hypothetical protein [Treponema sp.]
MKKIFPLLFVFVIVFFVFSCKSTPQVVEEVFHPASSLEDLIGLWISENGEYEYPFLLGNKKYIRFANSATDDTEIWEEFAASHGMDLKTLWKKRFSFLPYIYVPEGYKDTIPLSDSHGSEYGIKTFIQDGRIFSRKEMIIPEKILITNLRYFLLSQDEKSFKEDGTFYLASDVLNDLTADGTLYFKKNLDDGQGGL